MRFSHNSLLAVIIAGALIFGCSSNSTADTAQKSKDTTVSFDLDSMKKIIEEQNKAFATALIHGDSAALVNHYTVDGKIFAPNAPIASGRAGIASLVSEYIKFGIKEFRDETTAVYGTEDNLIEEGNYSMGDDKGNSIDKGKYLCVWRKIGGEWKIYADIFNSDIPLPAPKK